jgi:hypothetical protein
MFDSVMVLGLEVAEDVSDDGTETRKSAARQSEKLGTDLLIIGTRTVGI